MTKIIWCIGPQAEKIFALAFLWVFFNLFVYFGYYFDFLLPHLAIPKVVLFIFHVPLLVPRTGVLSPLMVSLDLQGYNLNSRFDAVTIDTITIILLFIRFTWQSINV